MTFEGTVLLISIAFGIVAAIHWRRNKQSIRKGFGFTLSWWAPIDVLAGMLITTIAMLGIFLVELLSSNIRVVGTQLNMASIGNALNLLILGAVLEEFLNRALLLSGLVIVLGKRRWLAVIIAAILFGASHLANPNASYIGAFGNALGGIIYGIAFLGGKNIWLPLGLHFAWNFAQGPIFGFPVSGEPFGGFVVQQTIGPDTITGGAYGPEAGLVGMIFRFVVMALVIVYLQWRCHGQGDIRTIAFPITGYRNPPNGEPGSALSQPTS